MCVTPQLDAFVTSHPAEFGLTDLLRSIHWALEDARRPEPGIGPYGALAHIADAVETYFDDIHHQDADDE